MYIYVIKQSLIKSINMKNTSKTVLAGMTKAIKITTDPDNGTKQIRLNADFFKEQGVTFNDYFKDPIVLEIYNEDTREIILQ